MRQLKILNQVTSRDSLAFDKYLQDISRKEMISPQEEIELAKQIKDGDQLAVDKLVSANLRFVVSVAKQYQNQGLSLQDLVNEGNLGLIIAAKRFDETRGFKFISYAVWWIRQSIMHAIAVKGRMIRLPLNKIGALNKINSASNKLEQLFQREPTLNELAEETNMKFEYLDETLKSQIRVLSIDAPIGNDDNDDFTLSDLIGLNNNRSTDSTLMNSSLKYEINMFLLVLNERERKIIKMYFGLDGYEPKSFEEIAEAIELTSERVRQLKELALRKLKQTSKRNKLRAYLL